MWISWREVGLGEADVFLFSSPKICLISVQPIDTDKRYGCKKVYLHSSQTQTILVVIYISLLWKCKPFCSQKTGQASSQDP